MKRYRVYFLGADNRVASHRDFEARNDAEALVKARAIHTQEQIWQGFELWRGRHCVYSSAR